MLLLSYWDCQSTVCLVAAAVDFCTNNRRLFGFEVGGARDHYGGDHFHYSLGLLAFGTCSRSHVAYGCHHWRQAS